MPAPPVQYAQTSDRYNIAYGVSGQGTPLMFLPTYDHLVLAWQYPGLGEWLELLSQRFQLIQLDPRGSGLSTRGLPPSHSADAYQLDLASVVERLNLRRFVILGVGPSMRIAARYAFENPDRVSALVCESAGVSARTTALFQTLPEQDWDWFIQSLAPRDISPEEAKLRFDLTKQAYTQEDFVLKMRASLPGPTTGHLAGLRVPCLVLQPRDYALLRPEQAAEVAQVARGSLVLIDGSTAFGDPHQGVDAIESFLGSRDTRDTSTPPLAAEALSAREREVLHLIAAGRSNQQIADQLVLSINTVQRHVSNILAKTGAANRTEAAIYGRDNGLA